MKIVTTYIFLTLSAGMLIAQPGQVQIPRINQMPDMPEPYQMRDWNRVAERYDTLVFSMQSQGTHFPLLSIGSTGMNYPEIAPIFMDSYVGSTSQGQQREAINILPALVGASLIGIDKTTQFGINWVDKARDFYNLANGEGVYLNGPSDRSGHDWWYETMPNIFFYQLYDLYPENAGFELHFRLVAERWLEAVIAMGGNAAPWTVPEMNYRAWNFREMTPLIGGVQEPEAAGAIAWILYQAYTELGDKKYLVGAQWCMEFLDSLESNPSYELQLPYGVLAAAKMNAEIGTNYDLEKMINWSFDRGGLRGWGSIVGTWGGMDVSGLIGEANDNGDDYAFAMNGFQQAAALVPMIKYDKRFAAAIAKWVLNVSNASRFFYADALNANQQSDYEWGQAHDPHSVIAYEALKENWEGTALYARGDAKAAGWAATNFALYGSSHVGYLAALADTTNVEGILKLNLNATNFFGDNPFPMFAFYNPFAEGQQINLQVGAVPKDLYDAINETILLENVSGQVQVTVPAGEVLLISYVPAGATLEALDGKLYANDEVLDHHFGYDFAPKLRIKSLSATSNPAELDIPDTIYSAVDPAGELSFQWEVNGEVQGSGDDFLIWTPSALGPAWVKVTVQQAGETVSDSLEIEVLELIPRDPIIDSLWTATNWHLPGEEIWIYALAHDPRDLPFSYQWEFEAGTVIETAGDSLKIGLPNEPGVFSVRLTVTNNYDKSASEVLQILVLENPGDIDPLIYLPLDGDVVDRSGNAYETQLQGTTFVADFREEADKALNFNLASDELRIPNASSLNFSEQITVSFWASVNDFNEERFIVSHGGWEQRWKVSVTETGRLRWTVNTTDGIKDLDTSQPVDRFQWNHFVMVYSGTSMIVYVNGVLDQFTSHSGAINPSSAAMVVGKRLPGDTQYYLKGRVDEIKVFDQAIGPDQAAKLKSQWSEFVPLAVADRGHSFQVYPNPAHDVVWVRYDASADQPSRIEIYDITGQRLMVQRIHSNPQKLAISLPGGVYFLRFTEKDRVLSVKKLIVE